LYVQALLLGISDALPAPDEAIRARLNELSADELRARLINVDPAAAERIHCNDRKRTIRAIEVFEQTGLRLSELQRQWDSPSQSHASVGVTAGIESTCAGGDSVPPTSVVGPCPAIASVFIVGLDHPVEAINRRINARVKLMMEQGLVEEVRALHAANRFGRNAREALGYKQIIEFLEGRCSLEEAMEQIKIRTRRYAKQQRTWLRRFRRWQPSIWLDAHERSTQTLADQALAAIEQIADRTAERTG
jgi:tRNA dimethylallyltransferase